MRRDPDRVIQLHKELTDLGESAEALERSMSSLQAMLKKLPGI
jgi:hypothetical protein